MVTPTSTYTTKTSTSCETITACDAEASKTTTTISSESAYVVITMAPYPDYTVMNDAEATSFAKSMKEMFESIWSDPTTSSATTKTTSSTTTTKTTESVPTANEYYAKYVIENEDTSLDGYGSKYDQFVFVMWGISWPDADDIESDITDMLSNCDVTADIHIEVDSAQWGTIAMWNNGENDVLDSCISGTIESLGGSTPDCQWIYKESEAEFPVEKTAEAEMTWIYDEHSSVITSPYPLST